MRPYLLLLISLLLATPGQPQKCNCRRVPEYETPNMGNMALVQNGGRMRTIRGRILFPNYITNSMTPGDNVIVEIYKHVPGIEAFRVPDRQPKIASCITGRDGRFCFTGIRAGKYVVRIGTRPSNSDGWNGTHVVVKLDPRHRGKRELNVIMQAAT